MAPRRLIGHFLFHPAVQASLDGQTKARGSHAAEAGLVLMAAPLAVAAVAIGRADAPVLESRSEDRQADGAAVLATAVAGGEQAADSGGVGYGTVHGIAVGDARGLAVAADRALLRDVHRQVVRLSSVEEDVLLHGHLLLLLLLLVSLLLDVVQVHGQRVARGVEQGCGGLRRVSIGRRAAVLRAVGRRRGDAVAARRRALLGLARGVAAPVLSEVDLELLVLLLAADGLDGLDGVGNVGEVDEGAALLAEGVDQLNLAVLGEVLAQPLLSPGLVQVANVDVARGSAADGEGDGGRQGAGVLAPANLEPSVVDHEALQAAEGVERRGGRGVDEGDEADVLVRDVADVVQQAAADHVANLLDGGLGVDVAEVDGPVAQVVHPAGAGGDGGGGHGLLGEGVGDEVSVGAGEHVRVARGDAQVLGGVLLLRFGDVGAPVLAVVDAAGSLPLGLLGQLGDGLDGVGDGQVVDEGDALLADNLDGVDGAKLAEVLAQLLVGHLFGEVAQVHVPGGAGLLNGQRHRRGHLGGLAPADLDVLALDAELLEDGIGVEVGGGAGVQEGDEGAVLVGQQANRLDLAAPDVAQDLLGAGVRGDVAEVDGSAGAGHHAGAHGNGRSRLHGALHAEGAGGRLGREELGRPVGRGRDESLVGLRGHAGLHGAGDAGAVLLAIGLLVLVLGLLEARQALELRASKGGRAAGLKGAAEEQLRREQRGELHIKGRAGGHVVAIGLVLAHVLGVERGHVGATRVAVGEARDVGGEGTMREASVAVGRLGSVAEARAIGTVRRPLASRAVEFLHPEEIMN
ncbi:hypothetical protein Trco_007716 [Trichoderma cornu-damae]|uniref:Uncharacterized protein n=1 Tax=Trichoderma cornu-damae TaxID=654480 RepID=A0A9P8QG36_9HYPO|nr:hypothetical protein Trco_007716 [Trichoderma cornu-damae]